MGFPEWGTSEFCVEASPSPSGRPIDATGFGR